MAIMVDSCVYLDIFTRDPHWFDWSSKALADAANRGTILLNPVIYAEISMRFDRIEELDALLSPEVFEYRDIPPEAAFLAGKVFLKYRRPGGTKTLPLPDFFIGAHAAIEKVPLITRDSRRLETWFPSLEVVRPEK